MKKKLTPKQIKSMKKNWLIFRLRGVLSIFTPENKHMLSNESYIRANKISDNIDYIIKELSS